MWGRVIEIMTAVWLAVSPFIFRVQSNATLLWADLGIALYDLRFFRLVVLAPYSPCAFADLARFSGIGRVGPICSVASPTSSPESHLRGFVRDDDRIDSQ